MRQRKGDPGVLEWAVSDPVPAVGCVRLRLTACPGARGSWRAPKLAAAPKCLIEVWAESTATSEEVAYCHTTVRLNWLGRSQQEAGNPRARVHWLGRSQQRAVHSSVAGVRCVPRRKVAEPSEGDGTAPVRDRRRLTVAEALFGIAAAAAERLGAKALELQAMDNGSGRLVQLYLDMGFTKASQEPGEILWMEAPVEAASALAPEAWLRWLLPAALDGPRWLRGVVAQKRGDQAMRSRPPGQQVWTVPWPPGARVYVRLERDLDCEPAYPCGNGEPVFEADLLAEAVMRKDGKELARVQGSLQLAGGRLQVLWLGRGRSEPVHPSVQGQAVYDVAGAAPHGGKVTVAMALLGALVTLARLVGGGTVALDVGAAGSGGGALGAYLARWGFERCRGVARPAGVEGGCGPEGAAGVWMEAPCDALARRLCPADWRAKLGWREDPDQAEAAAAVSAPGPAEALTQPARTRAEEPTPERPGSRALSRGAGGQQLRPLRPGTKEGGHLPSGTGRAPAQRTSAAWLGGVEGAAGGLPMVRTGSAAGGRPRRAAAEEARGPEAGGLPEAEAGRPTSAAGRLRLEQQRSAPCVRPAGVGAEEPPPGPGGSRSRQKLTPLGPVLDMLQHQRKHAVLRPA